MNKSCYFIEEAEILEQEGRIALCKKKDPKGIFGPCYAVTKVDPTSLETGWMQDYDLAKSYYDEAVAEFLGASRIVAVANIMQEIECETANIQEYRSIKFFDMARSCMYHREVLKAALKVLNPTE